MILGDETHEGLKEVIGAAREEAKTEKQRRKETEQEEQVVEDWAENLDISIAF